MNEKIEKKIVQLGHGGGGTLQTELIRYITDNITQKHVKSGIGVESFDDGATIPLNDYDYEIVVTADGHTINPLIFPGGDLGKLSVCGTINDIIMMGAKPIALTSIVLIEEGTTFEFVGKIMESFNKTAEKGNIAVIAGDTKVMPKGSLKDMVISTTGIGIRHKSRDIQDANCKPGAKIILTGSFGDHGAALIAHREGIDLSTKLKSDVAMLTPLINIVEKYTGIMAMKDPTRGGVASALNEWAEKSNVSIWVKEETLLVKKEVQSICEILGLDPMEIANEGKALLCVDDSQAEEILKAIKKTEIGKNARIIGEVHDDNPGMVIMKTPLGGSRMIERPMGEIIPRIC